MISTQEILQEESCEALNPTHTSSHENVDPGQNNVIINNRELQEARKKVCVKISFVTEWKVNRLGLGGDQVQQLDTVNNTVNRGNKFLDL